MGMAASSTHWTIARVRALPDDGRRYEVIDGELYASPAPTWEHQAAVQELLIQLRTYLAGTAIGHVVLSPADVEFRDDRMVEPDLFVVPLVDGRAPRDWQEAGRLLLAVEIVSPSTARADRLKKRTLYREERVDEYWVVDLDADYQLSAVSEPRREYLWILSRTPQLEPARYEALLQRLKAQGLDVDRLEHTPQGR